MQACRHSPHAQTGLVRTAGLGFDAAPAACLSANMDLLANPLFVATAALCVILLGLSKGGFIGLGVMALPLLSLLVPPLQAAAIILPTVLAQDMLTLWTYRRHWSAPNLKLLLPSMSTGMVMAWMFAAAMNAAHIRLAIGLIAAAFVLRQWLGARFERLAPRPNALTGALFGLIGGFTTMLANAGGPAWQMHILPQGLDKLTYVGTLAMLFAASNITGTSNATSFTMTARTPEKKKPRRNGVARSGLGLNKSTSSWTKGDCSFRSSRGNS